MTSRQAVLVSVLIVTPFVASLFLAERKSPAPTPAVVIQQMRVCHPFTCNGHNGCCQMFRNTCDWGVGSAYDCDVVLKAWEPKR